MPDVDLADVAATVLTDGWRSAVAGQLASITLDGFRQRVSRADRGRQFDCDALADLADELERAKEWAHDAIGVLARRGLARLRRSTAEQALGEALAKKIPLPGDEQIDQVVQSIRIVGVWVCLIGGVDVAARCRCLAALAEERTKEELTSVLEEKLNAAVGRAPTG